MDEPSTAKIRRITNYKEYVRFEIFCFNFKIKSKHQIVTQTQLQGE